MILGVIDFYSQTLSLWFSTEYWDFRLATFWKESSVMAPEGPAWAALWEPGAGRMNAAVKETGLISAARSWQPTGNDEICRENSAGSRRSDIPAGLGLGGGRHGSGPAKLGSEAGVWQKNVSVPFRLYISFRADLYESRIFIDFVFSLSDCFNVHLSFSAHLVLELHGGKV